MIRPEHEKSFDDSTMLMRMKASKGVVSLASHALDLTGERNKRISKPKLGLIPSEDPETWETLDSKRASNRSGDRPWNRPIRPVEGATMMRAGLKSQDGPNMHRTLALAALLAVSSIFASGFGTAALAQDYVVTTTPLGFTSISGNPTATQITFTDTNEGEVDVPIPFNISFFGTTRTMGTNLRVATNGGVSFNSAFDPDFNVFGNNLNATAVQGDSLFLGLDDMDVSSGGVFFETIGTTPNRSFIVEYSMVPNFDPLGITLLDAQVVFNENGTIEFRYSSLNFFEPTFVTVGIKSTTGLTRGFPNTNVGAPTPTENVLFTPAALAADLAVSTPTVSPLSFLAGDSITVATTVSNLGQVNSGNFNVSVYLSIDATIDSNDQLIGTFTGSQQLNIGAMTSLSQSFVVPTPNPVGPSRSYFVGVIADPAMAIADNIRSNNTAGRSVLLGPPNYLVQRPARTTFNSIRGTSGANPIASTPISGTTTIDDVLIPHPTGSPFAFTYFGVQINAGDPVDLHSNGWVDFLAQNSAVLGFDSRNNLAFPKTSSPVGITAPYWDDLILRATKDSAILDSVVGTAPNRLWIIEFSQIDTFSTTGMANFQIVVEESTNIIRFLYDSTSTIGGSANIGMENSAGDDGFNIAPPTGTTFNAIPPTDVVFIPQGNAGFTVDFTASNVSATPTMASAGGSLSITRTITNGGSSTAGSFQVTYVLSTNSNFDLNDQVIGTETIATLGAGQNNTATMSFAIPTMTPAGNYFVGVIANTNTSNPVLESDFFNNTAGTAAAIQVAAPGKAQGDLNGDLSIDIADVMLCITAAISADPSSAANVMAADLNNDNVVNILDVQIEINRVLAAP